MMNTEAFVLIGKGNPEKAFELRKVTLPQLQPGQVHIKVEGFGLNYADVMARKGLYRETPPLPAVIGYEVVGKVIAAGDPADAHLIGKRVVGFTRFGGYSKDVITFTDTIAEVGDLPLGEALALATQWVTAYYMVNIAANVMKGDKVLVHAAAGGVGTALIQLCKMKGAVVIAKIGSRSKEKIVTDLGADHVIIYTESDYEAQVKALPGLGKIDVSFNPIGGSSFKKDKALMGTGGRIVLFGGSELSDKFGIFSALNFLRKMGLVLPIGLMMQTRSLIGINMLRVAEDKQQLLSFCLQEVVKMALSGEIRPIVGKVYSQDQFNEAHSALESGKTTGKIAVSWHD